MCSTHVAQNNGLERELVELETLVLIRPPNVLLTDYLRALTAEDVLDASTAAQVCNTVNGMRYSTVPVDDTQISEAAVSLARIVARLAAMSPEDREQIAVRVRERIQLPVDEPEPALDEPVPPVGQNLAARPNHGNVAPVPRKTFRRAGLPRVSLGISALAALATFLGGYSLHAAAGRREEAIVSPSSFKAPIAPKGAPDFWLETIRSLGNEEARAKRYGKARVALELALAYSQENAKTLNDLAWYYLQPDESGTNPQRALKLVNRALDLNRSGTFLDTAAEAHFQLGDFGEAVRLEREALTLLRRYTSFQGKVSGGRVAALRSQLETQLQKFQDAERIHATPVL
jgi:tetratricopeptide (TPR) repeat protein